MAKKPWLETTIAKQILQLQNFNNKIEGHSDSLGLTEGQVSDMQKVCEDAIAAINFAEGCKSSMQGVTTWKNEVLTGSPKGSPAPPPPVFPQNAPPNVNKGLITSFIGYRDYIVALPTYELSIGEDLGLVGAEITPKPEGSFHPELTVKAITGFAAAISGSMQGMDGMRIEYATGDGKYITVGFFTNKPGTVYIEPQVPGQPERGRIRAIFIKKSQDYGEYSPNYPVTLS